jgi:Family of unknown function (DUF6159)
MGSLARTWDLVKQSFSILMSDKELMWLPILSAIFNIAATVVICGGGFLFVVPPGPLPQGPEAQRMLQQHLAPFLFLFYVATYSVSVYFNVALVSIASNRLAGGQAKLSDGLQVAWDRKWSILQWALLAATLGTILQIIERRTSFIGRMLTRGTALMFSLASFFIAPVLAAQNMGPMQALYCSSQVFKKQWGEQIAGGVSFQMLSLLFALLGALPPAMGAHRFGQTGLMVGFAISVVYWLLLAVSMSAARGIFVAALYRYATEGQVPLGFDRSDLSSAFKPKNYTGF